MYEFNLQYFITMKEVITKYVKEHKKYPENVEVLLETVRHQGRWADFSWPEKSENVLKAVRVNFPPPGVDICAFIEAGNELIIVPDPIYKNSHQIRNEALKCTIMNELCGKNYDIFEPLR